MSEEKPQQPVAGSRAAAGKKAPAGARTTAGGKAPAGARATAGGKAPAGAKTTAGAKQTTPATGAPPAPPTVVLKKFSPVYIVRSQNADLTCTLCRNSLDEVCNHCLEKRITDTSLCPVVRGLCGHQYHSHCISEWTKKQNICPAHGCGARWENA